MAISTASGFQVGSSEAIDSRLVLTKNEMLTVNENVYPEVYICVCKDDGLLYIFNKKNEIDNETGKFRVVTSNTSIPEDLLDDLHVHSNKEVIDNITEEKVASWDSKATESFVNNAIAQAQLGGGDGNVDLSGYATKDDLAEKADTGHKHVLSDITDYVTPDLSEYAKVETVNNDIGEMTNRIDYIQGRFTVELNEKADKSDIPDLTNYVVKEEGKGLFSGSYNDLTDKPDISVGGSGLSEELKAAYDDAVEKAHTHINKTVLDKLSESVDGTLLFDGDEIQGGGETIIIDPLDHVNEKYGIEDTPVGHVMDCMSSTVPAHYLLCDGSEYNIADYPYLAQHILDEFGSVNYFGGDGTTSFAIPNLTESATTTEFSPKMTSATTPSPYKVTASSALTSYGYVEYCAFDNNTSTLWHSDTVLTEEWLLFDAGEAMQISGFKIFPRSGYNNQAPARFTLQGSNDGEQFDDIITFDNAWTTSETSKTYSCPVSNYRYYRFWFPEYPSAHTQNMVSLSEIKFLLYEAPDTVTCIKFEPTYFMQNFYTGNEEIILWDGSAVVDCSTEGISQPNVTINLADNIRNYDRIEIRYCALNPSTNERTGHTFQEVIPSEITIGDNLVDVFLINQFNHHYNVAGNFTDIKTLILQNVRVDGVDTNMKAIVVYKIVGIKTSYNANGSLSLCESYTDEEVSNAIDNILGGEA